MWIFTNNAFLSVVADKDNPTRGNLLVRSRVRDHILNVFPKAIVFSLQDSDYAYRAWVSRADVKAAMVNQVDNLDYTNFKDAISDNSYHDAALGVWSVMYKYQQRHSGLPRF
jgi:hypothetical protein